MREISKKYLRLQSQHVEACPSRNNYFYHLPLNIQEKITAVMQNIFSEQSCQSVYKNI